MLNIPLISDLHFGSNNFHKGRFESQMEFFEKQFFPYCLENNVTDVINLGDTVHNRNTIDLYILQEMKTRFFKWFEDHNITMHLILGNHDLNKRNTLDYNFFAENVNEFKKIIVYNKQTIVKIGNYTIGMIPWIVEPKKYKNPKGCDILAGHFEINEMPMMKNIMSHSGFVPELFKDIHYVFSGHYHIKSRRDNIIYTGTQYQLTMNDFDEDKGFYVLKDNFDLEFISNTINPKFIKLYYNEGNIREAGLIQNEIHSISREEAVAIAKSNFIKLYSEKCIDQFDFDSFYTSLSNVSKNDYKIEVVNTEQVIEDYDFTELESALDTDSNTIDLIMSYINGMTFEKGIDKEMLLNLSKQLYQEAYNESIGMEET